MSAERIAIAAAVAAVVAVIGAKEGTKRFDHSVDILARTIWGEARGEGSDGMKAVAAVIMNRVQKGGWWGNTIEEVCKKPYQFSCWNPGDPNLHKVQTVTLDNPAFKKAYQIAQYAISGQLDDMTGGATHYHTTSITASWSSSLTPTGTIGSHIFYV